MHFELLHEVFTMLPMPTTYALKRSRSDSDLHALGILPKRQNHGNDIAAKTPHDLALARAHNRCQAPILKLPPELLLAIGKQASFTPPELYSAGSVCRAFHDLMQDNELWTCYTPCNEAQKPTKPGAHRLAFERRGGTQKAVADMYKGYPCFLEPDHEDFASLFRGDTTTIEKQCWLSDVQEITKKVATSYDFALAAASCLQNTEAELETPWALDANIVAQSCRQSNAGLVFVLPKH